jgi:GTPase SAR1 family protein
MLKPKRPLSLLASKRFIDNYKIASLNLKRCAEGAVRDLVNRYRSDPRILASCYDKIEGQKIRILEGDLSGKDRFLFDYSENCITLLDMGGHDVVRRYDSSKYHHDMNSAAKAPDQFSPDKKGTFFVDYPDPTVSVNYFEESSAEWLYFLENEQKRALEEIESSFLYEPEKCSTFIVGGPGTGKTCILLSLLRFLSEDYRVGITISPEVMRYIEQTTRADLAQFRVDLNASPELDLLLIDDPSQHQLERALMLKRTGQIGAVVAAFDPLQLDEAISDEEFQDMCDDHQIKVRILRQCYRQKKNLGENTKRIAERIAESTPFVAEHKIQAFHSERKELTKLSNNLEFVNPHGYIKTYVNTTVDDVRNEVRRISNSTMWEHSQGLLVLLGNCELIPDAEALFSRLQHRNYVKTVSFNETNFNQVSRIKGLDFQHVFIFINKALFDDLENGFRGTGKNVYKQRRLLRIPFSRAKDSLVTFAVDD